MPGLNPDQQAMARRLSFSEADAAKPPRASRSLQKGQRRQPSQYDHAPSRLSVLPPIREGSSEGQEAEAETAVNPSQRAARPSVPITSSTTLYPSQGEVPHPTYAPVTTSMVLAAPTPFWSQQLQDSVAAAATASEYQRQLQEAMQREAVAAAAAAAAATRARVRVRQLKLLTVASGPAGYNTKWDDLHPASQRLLLRIEEKLREYKYQSQLLDQYSCFHDPSSYNKSFELNANQVMQETGSTCITMNRAKVSIKGLTDAVEQMMWNIDIVLQSYVKLRPRFVQRGAGGAASYANLPGSSGGYTKFNQRLTKAPNFCCYSGAPRRPSPFIQHTVARFEEQIGECFIRAEELEQLVQLKNDKSFPESLESLSKVISNMHDYFIYVASKLEDIHQAVEAMKAQYLNARRCRGDCNDPFVDADTRESAKQEAAVRMIHPTLHLSLPSQPKIPVTASVLASQLQEKLISHGRNFSKLLSSSSTALTFAYIQHAMKPFSNNQPFNLVSHLLSLHFLQHHMELFSFRRDKIQASTGLHTKSRMGWHPRSRP